MAFDTEIPVATGASPQENSPVAHEDYKRVGKRPSEGSGDAEHAGQFEGGRDNIICGGEDGCEEKNVGDFLVGRGHGFDC